MAAVTLSVVALGFFVVERFGAKRRVQSSLGIVDAVVIGCAQAAALVPGVSRSGATITAAMGLGMRRDESARFVFLLGVPAILAAAVREGWPLLRRGLPPGEASLFVTGIATSAVVGYLAIRFFIRYRVESLAGRLRLVPPGAGRRGRRLVGSVGQASACR